MVKVMQASLAGGEVSPAVATRVDIDKYKSSVAAAENFFVQIHGGMSNRPGLEFVAEVKDSSAAVRIIPFEFNTEQTYILEFGEQYMRVVKDGGQVLVTGAQKTINAVTKADPAVVTTTAVHGMLAGDGVFVSGVVGMTELNGRAFRVGTVPTTSSFQLLDYDGNNIDSSAYTTYSSAGNSQEIFTLATPYTAAQVFDLKFVQSADTMTLCHPSHAPRELTRTGHSAWTLSTITFAPEQAAPTSPTVTPDVGASTTWNYQITAVNDESSEESLPLSTSTSTGATSPANVIAWTGAAGATVHNIYRQENGIYGFIGRTETDTFHDENVQPVLTDTPPKARNPFSGADLYPSVVGYFKQRRVFGNSNNFLQRMFLSQTGVHSNMSVSSPTKDDDAITATIASQQVNEIRHFVALADLIILTSGAEWKFSGVDGLITPASIQIEPQTYYGATQLPPITAGDVVLFMQSGQTVRDLSYKFELDTYAGNDISILARHLFDENLFVDWAYAQAPHSNVWVVRDDGIIVALTYVREQKIYGWSRHTTKGLFKSVASIQEGDEDVMYAVVERTVGTRTRKYIERQHHHLLADIQDAFYVDSGKSLDNPITITGYTQANPVVVTTGSAHGFSNGDTVDINGIKSKDATVTPGWSLSTEITGVGYTVANVAATTFELQLNAANVDGTGFAAYHAGGQAREATATLGGLWHLEGETVVALANGYVVKNLTVTNGSVTLPNAASRVHIGLPYTAELETLRLDNGNLADTIQAKSKKMSRLTMRLEKTLGLWHGPDRDHMYEAKFGLPRLWGQTIAMITGDKDVTLSPSWNKDGQIVIQQRDPLPATILAVLPDVIVGGN